MTSGIRLTTLSASHADDAELVSALSHLVNGVYEVAEQGLWEPQSARTTAEEVASLLRSGEITAAFLDGELVGCVRIHELSDRICEFGMLAAAPHRRGAGIGRELVRFAEAFAVEHGREIMQLELLVPREWSHPSKEFLTAWYTRIGYRPVRTGRLEESYPALAVHLATPCDLVIHHKDLQPQVRTASSST
ncbi:GNAT family N-acetyltransferase [Agromyces albus]|uniref:GNAT family N-acetyltransferase n=1 Tax=Agromyces albus TaxID=205332 RepID=UPI002786EF02|nr:GNAT family N-acetyltransferase [Agromyces albus]MDQ0577076.1 GNAT superfamily N-acetyltransferase [Agromyces albus]